MVIGKKGEEELRVELEETLVDSMLSEEKGDEEIDGGDVGSDNDTVILLMYKMRMKSEL